MSCLLWDVRSWSIAMSEALLLDLGNVVVELDFHRTFRRWADAAAVDVSLLAERWAEDDAYRSHERGHLSFEDYTASLSERLGISIEPEAWKAGWNDVFVAPYPRVQAQLRTLVQRIPLYAFTNTNPTHEQAWRARYADAVGHFEDIFVSSRIGLRKPDTAAFDWVASAMAMDPATVLFIDDNLENIEGARAAGFQTAWVHSEDDVVRVLSRF